MSIKLMAEVFETDLPAGEKLVLLAMADHADDSGDNCFPSIPRIAKKASMTRRGVQKVVRRLEEKKLVRRKGLRPGGTIEYSITLPRGANVVRGGERGSRGEGRTVFAGGANEVRVGGERSSPESSLEPPLNHQGEKSIPAPPKAAARTQEPPAGFLRFWQAYPRKIDKQDALRGWIKYGLEREADQILAGLARWKACEQWRGDEQYIPHAATFLNKRRWESKPPAMTMKGGAGNGKHPSNNFETTLASHASAEGFAN